MTKKEYCTTHPAIAYYSGFGGLEVHGIEYGIDDYLFCVSGAWGGEKSYHRLKIQYDRNGDTFIRLHGHKVPLRECVKTGV